MITNKITELTNYVQTLSKKDFQQYVLVAIAAVAIISLGATYYIYSASSSLKKEITKINNQTNKIKMLIAQNARLAQEEEGIRKLLDKNDDFTMTSYFEQFYTKQNIKPESGWKPVDGDVIEGSEAGVKYQEIILNATFKNQTMQKLVTILQAIYSEPRIYLKELDINADKSKISFELVLATKVYKKELSETE